eukprot:jgi/Chlat1/4600/Chrsp290S04336
MGGEREGAGGAGPEGRAEAAATLAVRAAGDHASADGRRDATHTVDIPARAASLTFTERLVAGAASRGFAQTLLHPLEVLKTFVQSAQPDAAWRSARSGRALLRGIGPQATLAFPAGALQFAAYEGVLDLLRNLEPDNNGRGWQQAQNFGAGLVAGAAGAVGASVVRVPQEVLKQRIAIGIYPNMLQAVPIMYQQGGLLAFYRGFQAQLSRDVPWNTLSFCLYEQLRSRMNRSNNTPLTYWQSLGVGVASGSISAVLVTPLDVVKTRIMTGQALGTNVVEVAAAIARTEGVSALFRGSLLRVLHLGPFAALTLSTFDYLRVQILERKQAGGPVDTLALSRPAERPTPTMNCWRERSRCGDMWCTQVLEACEYHWH